MGAGLFKDSALIGTFSLPPSNVTLINMIFVSTDPWIIPTPGQIDSFGDSMPLSPTEQAYQEVILASTDALEIHVVFNVNMDTYLPSPWFGSWDSSDPLNETFPIDENIVEVISLDETP